MKAIGIPWRGDANVLEVVDRTVRDAGPGEVRIRVRAAAVNPADIQLRQGGVDGIPPPWVPGMEAAGVVESVGDGVERLAVGDEVMAAINPRRPEGGAQAELVVVPAASVVWIPDGATLEASATLPMNGMTAFLGLELLDLEPGQTLAVSGGAGQLASYVIPIAKMRGLRVVADSSRADEALVRGFGADLVLRRGARYPDDVRDALGGDGADGLFDTAGLGPAAVPAVRDGGRLAVVRGWAGDDPERGIEVKRVGVSAEMQRTEWLEQLRALAADGTLQLRVVHTYSPEEAREAHRAMEAGGLRGRGVIVF